MKRWKTVSLFFKCFVYERFYFLQIVLIKVWGIFLMSSLLFLVIDTHVIKSQALAFEFCCRVGQDSSVFEPEKKVEEGFNVQPVTVCQYD